MATTTLPPVPAPERRSAPTGGRFVSIRASLLPPEIDAKRRLADLKRRIGLGLVALVVLLVAWFAYGWLQTSQAKSDLTTVQHRSQSLRAQQSQFGSLVTAQAQAAAIKAQLTKLMVGDVRWTDMLATLRKSATHGVKIGSITATVTAGGASTNSAAGAAAGLGVLNQTGKQPIGALAIQGTAPDKNAVAAFIDTLTKVKGLAAPFPASVSGDKGTVTFSASVIITSDALGGRYATTQGGH